MPIARQTPHSESPIARPQPISAQDSARYIGDMLESLRKIACGQGHDLLAHLLELARVEAKSLASNQDQQTRLPG